MFLIQDRFGLGKAINIITYHQRKNKSRLYKYCGNNKKYAHNFFLFSSESWQIYFTIKEVLGDLFKLDFWITYISLYSYPDIYLPHKGTFPISLFPHFPLWAYLPWVRFALLFLLRTSCLFTSSIFFPNVWYKVKRQELLLKFEVPSALFSFSDPSAGEGLFTSPAAAFTGEMNYSSVQTACLRTRRSDPNEAKDCLSGSTASTCQQRAAGTSRKPLSFFTVVTLLRMREIAGQP